MTSTNLAETSRPFLAYLDEWYATLPDLALAELIGREPERVALISIDVINGFCTEERAASRRTSGGSHGRWPSCSRAPTRSACGTSRSPRTRTIRTRPSSAPTRRTA